jgi:NAD(P)H-hydrate epimerase
VKIVTGAEMALIDRLAAERHGVPAGTLMEAAGRRVAEAAALLLGDPRGKRAVVVCGRGNNGGDGYVAARLLLGEGCAVAVFALADAAALCGDARAAAEGAMRAGVPVHLLDGEPSLELLRTRAREADLVVDALFGTGFRPPARGLAAAVIAAINGCARPVLAVDMPSGLSADHGTIEGPAVAATATVTLGLPKPGLLLHPAAGLAGRLWLADIGIPPQIPASLPLLANVTTAADAAGWLTPRDPAAHKGTYGHALIVAGSSGMAGAALLAARGALRAGAGLVTVALPASLAPAHLDGLPEAMLLPLPDAGLGALGTDALEALLEQLPRFQALAVGPGLSRRPGTAVLVRGLLARAALPLLVDADALAACADLDGPLAPGAPATVLTPHPGELARLTGTTVAQVQGDRLGAARAAATRFGAVVVLKGARTVTATPGGEAWVNLSGNPAMAAGGMGDVLAGMVAAHLARGMAALPAALLGVHLHGLAADRLAARRGPWGILAAEVADESPAAVAATLEDARDARPRTPGLSLLVP